MDRLKLSYYTYQKTEFIINKSLSNDSLSEESLLHWHPEYSSLVPFLVYDVAPMMSIITNTISIAFKKLFSDIIHLVQKIIKLIK